MTAICASHYRNPMNDFVGRKHYHKNRFRQRQSSRSAFYRPGLRVTGIDEERQTGDSSSSSRRIQCGNSISISSSNTEKQFQQQQQQQQQQHQASQHEHSLHHQQQQQKQQQQTPEGHWGFRPSALQYENYGTGEMGVPEIVDWYVRDNETAASEGVAVPPRPATVPRFHHRKLMDVRDALFSASSSSSAAAASITGPSSSSSTSSSLRCLQWNIQAFTSPKDERNMHTITAGIIRAICETDSDVLVLNEIHWREMQMLCNENNANPVPHYHHCERTKKVIGSSQALLEEVLRLRGYHFSRVANHGDTPTMIATRKKILDHKEIVLSGNRSALCLLLEASSSFSQNGPCWVVGTHLDAFDAGARRSEIRTLLGELSGGGGRSVPILIAGDFNQQRSRDYTESEWKRVASNACLRKVPLDDGVCGILEESGFRCVLDDARKNTNDHSGSASAGASQGVLCNWNQNQPPPSTHWSGTTIDYTYYFSNSNNSNNNNNQRSSTATTTTTLAPHGVYVGPAGFSDHRMTVTDWTLTTTGSGNRCASQNNSPSPKHIDKSFFFDHLPAGRHHSWLFNHCDKKATDHNNNNNTRSSRNTTSSVPASPSTEFSSIEFVAAAFRGRGDTGTDHSRELFRA